MAIRAFSIQRCVFVLAGVLVLGSSMIVDPATAAPPTNPSTTLAPPGDPTTTVPPPVPTTTLVQVQGTIHVTPEVAHTGSPYTVSGDICGIGWTITSFVVLSWDGDHRNAPGPVFPIGTIPEGIVQTATGFSFTRIAGNGVNEYVFVGCDDGVTHVSANEQSIPVFPADGSPRWRLFSMTHGGPDPEFFDALRPGTDAHVIIESGDCQVGTAASMTLTSANGSTVSVSMTMASFNGKSQASTAEFVLPLPRTFGSTGDSVTAVLACTTAAGPRTFTLAWELGAVLPAGTQQLPGTGVSVGTTSVVVLGSTLIALGLVTTRLPKRRRTR